LSISIVFLAPPVATADNETGRFRLDVPHFTVTPDVVVAEGEAPAGQTLNLLLQAPQDGAGSPSAQGQPLSSLFGRPPLRKGSWELGAIGAFSISGNGGPSIGTVVRALWLMPHIGYTFAEVPWGSFQVYLAPQTALIITPQKTYILGLAAIFRHTFFVSRYLSPYIDGGAGFLNTNLRTRALGESIEFDPQGGAGFYIHVAERVSLNAGYRFHHISNAGLGERNLGINSHFVYGGFSVFY
jgi:hypothetical protein